MQVNNRLFEIVYILMQKRKTTAKDFVCLTRNEKSKRTRWKRYFGEKDNGKFRDIVLGVKCYFHILQKCKVIFIKSML